RHVESGAKVTVVGRRQDRLDEFVQNVGATRAKGERFDIAELAQIPDFITRNHQTLIPLCLMRGCKTLTIRWIWTISSCKTSYPGSNLAIVPVATFPAYSASKVALNVFTLCLQEQLRHSDTRVIESSPPPVQSELHDYIGEQAGRKRGMPLDTFVQQVYQALTEGKDQIVLGSVGPADIFNRIVNNRRTAFEGLADMIRGGKP
ncbi:hypothetical protein N7490_005581, partial [Penicillium lividum]